MNLPRFVRFNPRLTLAVLTLVILGIATGIAKFQVDASADTLMNQQDADYQYSQSIDKRYESKETIVVVYRPKKQLFSQSEMDRFRLMKQELEAIDGVASVLSVLDVPIINYPQAPFGVTLNSPNVQLSIAELLFKNSPLYQDMLVSHDGQTTGLQIEVNRAVLRDSKRKAKFIEDIRSVITPYRNYAEVYVGGLDVIAHDMVTFLKQDLVMFGLLVLGSMVLVLRVIFRRWRWIFVALSCCVAAAITMMGVLGYLGLKVTVLSSNFISLQTILTMSLIIHLIVKFEELSLEHPDKDQRWLVCQAVEQKLTPSVFASLTTITGFAALLFSQIVPVIAFGWMMIAGLVVSLILTFFLFVALMLSVPKIDCQSKPIRRFSVTSFGIWVDRQHKLILLVSIVLLLAGGWGVANLKVENSFVNYFKKDTKINQSLVFIDKNLGGTTPLTILIDMPEASLDADDGFEGFEEFEESSDEAWLTRDKVDKIADIHRYLEAKPEVGKVMSIWTTVQVGEQVYGRVLGNFELAVLRNFLPVSLRQMLWDSYVSTEHEQLRITLRMFDSDPTLRRDEFLKIIQQDLTEQFGIPAENARLTGAAVIYNNVLQQLFDSQIRTLGILVVVVFLILLALLRNIRLAAIAIIPNILSVVVVLGVMGWLQIPLDLMTITIASITVGIAIDDAIHYIYRFRKEFLSHQNYTKALRRAHRSVGQAMVYTTLTISLGFGVLTFSSFIPNIYFGLLTALAMLVALLGSLTLMSVCLVLFKPFGAEKPLD